MKTIKSQEDIEALSKEAPSEEVIEHINNYFSCLMGVYGNDYDASEGFIVLLEEGDPITNKRFLEEKLCIRGGEDLVSIIKEFVDYDTNSNLFDVLVIFSADYALTYLIPNEPWVGEELLDQLLTFNNYSGNNSEQ